MIKEYSKKLQAQNSKYFWLFLKILISLSVLSILFSQLDFYQIKTCFLHINYWHVFLAILCTLLTQIWGGYAVKLQTDIEKNMPFSKILYYYLVSGSIAVFTPTQIGDASIIYYFKKNNLSLPTALSIYTTNKFTTIFLNFLVALIALNIYFGLPFLFFLGTIILLALALYIIFHTALFHFIRDRIIHKYLAKYYDFFRYFSDLIKKHSFIYGLVMVFIGFRIIAQSFIFFLYSEL